MSTEEPLAIGFSDLRGFSSYTAERGDREAFRLVQTFTELVDQQVSEHGGRVLKTYGDGVMTSYEQAEHAIDSAAGMQRALSVFNERHEDQPISAGIGLTWGPAIRTGDDLFGNAVNFAKRLADIAKGGQIIVSSSICDQMQDSTGTCFRSLGSRPIKGLGSHELFEYVWREEVANLCLTDNSVNVVLTEDDKLVLEFAKPIKETLLAMSAKLQPKPGESPTLAKLKRRVAKSLTQQMPKWIDVVERLDGMNVEHRLEDVEASLDDGKLLISLPGKRSFRFTKEQVNLSDASRFLEKLRELKQPQAPTPPGVVPPIEPRSDAS